MVAKECNGGSARLAAGMVVRVLSKMAMMSMSMSD